MDKRELSLPAAAQALGISYERVKRLLFTGQLQGRQADNGRWMVFAESLSQVAHDHATSQLETPRSDDTILTAQEVAEWLKTRPRQVERLGIPTLALGHKTIRYLRADVLEWLKAKRTDAGA